MITSSRFRAGPPGPARRSAWAFAGRLFAGCVFAGSAVACDDVTSSTTDTVYTEVYIDPSSFRGEVPCSDLPGGMKAFVGTLIDVSATDANTEPSLRVALPSSPPTGCSSRTGFSSVTAGHFYIGEIDGYDREICPAAAPTPGCISPLGGATSGSRVMVDDAGAVVAPRWTTACGNPAVVGTTRPTEIDAPTEALYLTPVPLRACVPMTLGGSSTDPTTSGVRIDSSALLGSLVCGAEPDQVDHLEVSVSVVESGGSAPLAAAPPPLFCGASAVVDHLEAGKTYLIDVLGYEANATTARWGARCSATASGGLTVPAACAPLRDEGSLVVPAAALISGQGVACNEGQDKVVVDRLEASLVGVGRTTSGVCTADLRFGGLASGSYSVATVGFSADGTEAFSTVCRGDVIPGLETIASCDDATSLPAP
jgi:hypothetical protein